jgi:CheY-like chemotaxis protein
MLSDGLNCGCTTIIELPLYKYPPALPLTSTTVRSTNTVPSTGAKTNPMNSSATAKKAESSPDQGSNCSLTSTCTPTNALSTEETMVKNETPNNEMLNGEIPKKGRRCLVVDDSLPNRKMLVRLLERCGHTCLSANNGKEAVDMIDADYVAAIRDRNHIPIDSILMDYEMPIMNGPDATRIIRDKGYQDVLIIGVTGNVLTEDVNYFISHGANIVLPKPVKVSSLEEYWETVSSER